MLVKLYNTKSPNNTINKQLTFIKDINVILKEITDFGNLSLTLTGLIPSNCNYLYIPKFNKYYYILEPVSLKNNLYLLKGKIDVLMTYKNDILSNVGMVSLSQKENKMLNDNRYAIQSNNEYETVAFSSGLSSNLNFILVTAGG